MAHAFFEAREFLLDVQLADQHVEVSSLVTHVDAQARRVVDDDDGQRHGDGEGSRGDTGVISDRSRQRDDESGVGGRHVAVGHDITDVPAVAQGIEDVFCYLHDSTDQDRNDEDVIGLQEFHIFYLILMLSRILAYFDPLKNIS
ncbi:MAG: hypothetical protein UY41_C0007G0026 [Candidatus Moranbacteria bacterium GW2011_GWE1_49_15]|nr:MAG: hypothetical protein UY41_C0007G0026 [Candidatus Moranbacteria bacterium GW2011_GWE1_49_15]